MRQHHENDAMAEAKQRAMLDAHRRHTARNSIPAIVARAEKRFTTKATSVDRRRKSNPFTPEHPTADQWQLFLSSSDFASFLCRILKIDLMELDTAHWLKKVRVMSKTEIAGLIRECVGSSIDEWEQEERHGSPDYIHPDDRRKLQGVLHFLENGSSDARKHDSSQN